MSSIGYVNKQRGGYLGSFHTLSIRAEVEIIANADKMNDAQRPYCLLIEGNENSSAWMKATRSAKNM